MFTASAGTSGTGLAVLLIATIATLVISTSIGISTSITLALVGASAGAQIAHGELDTDRTLRVLGLAAAGPVVAWLMALAVTRLLTLARGRRLERTVRWPQITGFVATSVAYRANDGQKILAVFAVVFGVGVASAAVDPRVAGMVIVCFAAGTMLGLRRSVLGLRRGVLHPEPYQVASTLWASASAVLMDSAWRSSDEHDPVRHWCLHRLRLAPEVATCAMAADSSGGARVAVDSAGGGVIGWALTLVTAAIEI